MTPAARQIPPGALMIMGLGAGAQQSHDHDRRGVCPGLRAAVRPMLFVQEEEVDD